MLAFGLTSDEFYVIGPPRMSKKVPERPQRTIKDSVEHQAEAKPAAQALKCLSVYT